jgi:hypothetical protein
MVTTGNRLQNHASCDPTDPIFPYCQTFSLNKKSQCPYLALRRYMDNTSISVFSTLGYSDTCQQSLLTRRPVCSKFVRWVHAHQYLCYRRRTNERHSRPPLNREWHMAGKSIAFKVHGMPMIQTPFARIIPMKLPLRYSFSLHTLCETAYSSLAPWIHWCNVRSLCTWAECCALKAAERYT